MQELQATRKEQDKSWQRKMQKLSVSYRDQLTEVSTVRNIWYSMVVVIILMQSVAKLDSLEQTILEGSKNERKDKKVSKQLKSLQQVSVIILRCC